MKNNNDLTRRGFLLSLGAISGSTALRLSATSLAAITQAACGARDEQAAFEVLGNAEASDLAAIAARIIPTTDTPGATEAGVIHFFDKALGAEMSDRLAEVRKGLTALNDSIPAEDRFADLSPEEQDDRLREIESGPFFALVREMTIYGFFAMEKYGGNRDHIGWDLIGFKGHNGGWTYPFGYYDAQVHGKTSDGE